MQIFIPEGDAYLGNEGYEEEIYLDGYWIDQIPVSAAAYKKYLSNPFMLAPRYRDEYSKFWQQKKYELLPVVFISWGQAEEYCEYYGGHLPTESQWEKAARGTQGISLYWDESEKSYKKANYDNFFNGVTPSGWLPEGHTVYGLMDMSGNVREWVLDRFISPWEFIRQDNWEVLRDEEAEPEFGRILKGGSYVDDQSHLMLNNRDNHDPSSPGVNRGFRCVYDN